MTRGQAILIVSLTVLITGCHVQDVNLTDMDSPAMAITDHTLTIRPSSYLFNRPATWVYPKAKVQGQTIYLYGCRTLWEETNEYVVRLPASVNPQSVSVIWVDPDGSKLRIPIQNVKLTDMDSPPRVAVSGHTVTIQLASYLFNRPATWVYPEAKVQGQTIYLYGYRTHREQTNEYVVRLPASVNPQAVSVIWVDPDGSNLRIPITGCHVQDVKLTDLFSPPAATVTNHTVTIRLESYMFNRPPTWVYAKTEVQGQTIYLYGYRTLREQTNEYVIRLPASVNPQSFSVIWKDPDGNKLRIPMICPFGNAFINFAKNYQAAYTDAPPRFFWCGPGPTNGQTVLRGIRSGDPQSKADARALIGSTVTFDGEGGAHRSPDIQTQDGIKIVVKLVPYQAVGPGPCGMWGAEVQGKLESVDFSNRVVQIEAGPEHWIVTWQL